MDPTVGGHKTAGGIPNAVPNIEFWASGGGTG